jgi:hypothetical protein
MRTYFAKSKVLRPTFSSRIAFLYSSNASFVASLVSNDISSTFAEVFVLAQVLLVDRTPALSRDERIFTILAGGLGIDVPLEGGVGKTEGVKLTGSVLMMFATVLSS